MTHEEAEKDWHTDPTFQQAVIDHMKATGTYDEIVWMAREQRLSASRVYFSKMQPDWIVDAERGLLRAVIDGRELSTDKYILRHVIDVDLSLGSTPQELERLMLLQIIQGYRAAIVELLQKVKVE